MDLASQWDEQLLSRMIFGGTKFIVLGILHILSLHNLFIKAIIIFKHALYVVCQHNYLNKQNSFVEICNLKIMMSKALLYINSLAL